MKEKKLIGYYTNGAFYDAPIYRQYDEIKKEYIYYLNIKEATEYKTNKELESKNLEHCIIDDETLVYDITHPWDEVHFNFDEEENKWIWNSIVYDFIWICIIGDTQQDVVNIIQQIMAQYCDKIFKRNHKR